MTMTAPRTAVEREGLGNVPGGSRARSTGRAWAALGICLAALLASSARDGRAAPAAQPTIPAALVEKFRAIRALTADFREEKRMAILVAPIVRAGTIVYQAPGRLAMDTSQPAPSRLVLADNVLTMIDGQQRHTIDIDKQPAVGLLVRLLLGVLAGDVASLQRHARMAFRALPPAAGHGRKGRGSAGGGAWTLDLDPQDPLLAKLVKSLSVAGHDAVIDVLTLVDGNGDRTVTRFSNVKFLPGLSPQERAARFGTAP
jgi:outer membrane lipoprotein-sorting protein